MSRDLARQRRVCRVIQAHMHYRDLLSVHRVMLEPILLRLIQKHAYLVLEALFFQRLVDRVFLNVDRVLWEPQQPFQELQMMQTVSLELLFVRSERNRSIRMAHRRSLTASHFFVHIHYNLHRLMVLSCLKLLLD